MYLFCDRMTPLAKEGTRGQRCWSTGRVVQTKTLAVRLGVVAVLGLREAGLVAIEQYEGKKMFIKVRGVRAKIIAPSQAFGGIEEYLLGYFATGRRVGDGCDVGDAFNLMMPSGSNPYGDVVQKSIDDVIAHGYLARIPAQRGVRDKISHKPAFQLEAVPERIQEIKPTFESFVSRWNDFYEDERPLHDELQRTILNGISGREKSSGSSSYDD